MPDASHPFRTQLLTRSTLAVLVVLGAIAVMAGGPVDGVSMQEDGDNVTEEAYGAEAPEPGDPYFEAQSDEWISYENPRDEYRSPYLGDGSGKICVTLLNEAGEAIAGESVPNTTVTVPTGETIEWHSGADPMQVRFPLPDHYERPLDADQFGTSPDLPQGDGILDSHCIEFHGPSENATVEYGEAQVDGEYADRIEVVGYVQQAHDAWETDVDPIADAETYEATGGEWTYRPGASHGQVVVVLQLDAPETVDAGESATDTAEDTDDSPTPGNTERRTETDRQPTENSAPIDAADDDGTGQPGFGVPVALGALLATLALALHRRR